VLAIILGLLLVLAGTTALAQDAEAELAPEPVSFASLFINVDSGNTKDSQIYVELALPYDYRFFVGAGRTKNSSPTFVNTQSFFTGYSSDPVQPLVSGLEFGSWGNTEALITRHLRGSLSYNSDNWQLSLRSSLKGISVATKALVRWQDPSIKKLELYGMGIDLSWTYYTSFLVNVGAHWQEERYSRDLSVIDPDRVMQWLSYKASSLSSGLIQRSNSIFCEYEILPFVFRINVARTVSAIGQELQYASTLGLIWYLNKHFDVELSGGMQYDRASDSSVEFMGVSSSFSW